MQNIPDMPLEIDVQSVKRAIDGGDDLALIDCREADEYALAKLEGAKLLPMSEIADRLGELQGYRQKRIVVYCHMGGRSLRVARWLREQGFPQAQSMAGGIDEWSLEIDPSVPRY
jgi:rhodanese-related sulfurtransferase